MTPSYHDGGVAVCHGDVGGLTGGDLGQTACAVRLAGRRPAQGVLEALG